MERRSVQRTERPDYPSASEVLSERRGFLALFGKLTAGVALVASCGPPLRLGGKVMPPEEIPPQDPGLPPQVGCDPDDCPPLPGEPPPPDPPVPGGIRPPDPPMPGKIAVPEPPPDHPPLDGDVASPEEPEPE
jgi:hypothetical protein